MASVCQPHSTAGFEQEVRETLSGGKLQGVFGEQNAITLAGKRPGEENAHPTVQGPRGALVHVDIALNRKWDENIVMIILIPIK